MNNKEFWKKIYEKQEEINSLLISYWGDFSSMKDWQFWVVAASLVLPLVLLLFTVDRKRIFEVFFFGYTVHMIWTYFDLVLERYGYFTHKYFLTPKLPMASNMTASVLPVAFLLLYQYCTNRGKNFYLYTALLSAVFSFGFASLEIYAAGMAEFGHGMNLFYLFLIDIIIIYFSYWFTRLLLKVQNKSSV